MFVDVALKLLFRFLLLQWWWFYTNSRKLVRFVTRQEKKFRNG